MLSGTLQLRDLSRACRPGMHDRASLPTARRVCIAGYLLSSLRFGHCGLVAALIHTIKTHKAPGRVVVRPIHGAPSHPFGGLSRWVAAVITDVLRKYDHLVIDTTDFLNRSSSKHIPMDHLVLHYDLKDFFMSGSPQKLVSLKRPWIPASLREVFCDVCICLLYYQFVSPTAWNLRKDVYQCIIGTGMGLIHSMAISNTNAFYQGSWKLTSLFAFV